MLKSMERDQRARVETDCLQASVMSTAKQHDVHFVAKSAHHRKLSYSSCYSDATQSAEITLSTN